MIVTLLGTGTPFPTIERFGTSILVEAADEALLFDCGRGATVRLHQARVLSAHVASVFLTHLHSDHVDGLPDLWLTGWLLGRDVPLEVWGPDGTPELTSRLVRACAADVALWQAESDDLRATGAAIGSRVIQPGVVHAKRGVRVSAFPIDRGRTSGAVGYQIEHDGRTVVISSETRLSSSLIEAAAGAEVLIHAAWLADAMDRGPSRTRSIASAVDAGRVFARVKPGLAVLYHYQEDVALEESVRTFYDGPLVIGRDRMRIEVTRRGQADLMPCDRRMVV
jgi:ribonuclease Z